MSKGKNHIRELFTDSSSINEEGIVRALKPFVVIKKGTNEIYFKDELKLIVDDKILAYGLAKKLLKTKGYIDVDTISASEIHKSTGIKKGSIDPAFKNLKGKFLVGKDKDYEIPNYKINEIIKRLQEKTQIKT